MGCLFDKMPHKDCVLWNVMLSSYVKNGDPSSVLEIFLEMKNSEIRPNLVTLVYCLFFFLCLFYFWFFFLFISKQRKVFFFLPFHFSIILIIHFCVVCRWMKQLFRQLL